MLCPCKCDSIRIIVCLHTTQVLSTSVADALAYFDDPSTKETKHFIRMFDKFFDCMNVRSMNEWVSKKKPNLKPYNNTDSRLKVDGLLLL